MVSGCDPAAATPPVLLSCQCPLPSALPTQITAMPVHRFRVGQTVVVPWSGPEGALPLEPYVIVRLLPVEDGEPHYRVRNSTDGHEWALLES